MADMAQQDLSAVIANGWCIGCGVCTLVDPAIRLQLDPVKLMYQPSGPSGPAAARVCPAVQVDYDRLQRLLFPRMEIDEYGAVAAVLLAQSTDEQRNLRASSGGIVKEVLRFVLASGQVDGVIALQHEKGLTFRPTLVEKPDEIDQLPGSIYHNLDQSRTLQILKQRPGRYALVAIPCQLEGIFQYITAVEPALMDRVALTVGLLCGWQYSHHSLEAIGAYRKFDPSHIAQIAYRGGGPVGKLRIGLEDGTVHTVSRRIDFAYQVAFDRHFNVPRCHLCVNHSNFLSDLVVGDAWLPSTVTTRTGISLVIARRPESEALVQAMARKGTIVTTPVTVEEIRESQTNRVIFGDFAYAYADFLDQQGIVHPNLVGPNRSRATKAPYPKVAQFHRELQVKLKLQHARRYRRLWWRKATVEMPRLFMRYLTWFGVRVLRLKSLTGQRQEVRKDQLERFR